MNITGLKIYSNNVSLFTFNYQDLAGPAPYQIRQILGLDADELIPKFYAFSTTGKKYYDVALPPREIVIKIGLTPRFELGESVASLRANLYSIISATRISEIELRFLDGVTEKVKITGFITRFEAPPFSKTPTVTLTIKCNDPVFRGINTIELLEPDLNDTNPVLVTDNLSTAPHGFDLKVTLVGASSEFTIQDQASSPEWKFRIVPATAFASGDQVFISTEFGKKHVYMIRGATTTYLMDKVDPVSVWPIIFPKVNSFNFNQVLTLDWNYLRYTESHWGL